jgi:hypothetical protein
LNVAAGASCCVGGRLLLSVAAGASCCVDGRLLLSMASRWLDGRQAGVCQVENCVLERSRRRKVWSLGTGVSFLTAQAGRCHNTMAM